jgi:hypothetical protein
VDVIVWEVGVPVADSPFVTGLPEGYYLGEVVTKNFDVETKVYQSLEHFQRERVGVN